MLRLLQAFLESAPQLVLQLYILQKRLPFEWKNDWLPAVAAGCSLISMTWAILAYSKSLRDFRKQGYKLSLAGLFFQILWRISVVTSRVVAMVLFASYFQKWLFVAVGAHWLIMTLWLICQRTRFCTDEDGNEHPYREKLFCTVIGFMYIFCFFNTREGMTRKRVVLFYSIILVENSLFVSMWYPHRTFEGTMAFAALGVVWGGLMFGIVCMVVYYRFYHPSLPVQGILLQKRTFDLEGQRTHTWVCCCCCRIKESREDTIEEKGLIRNANHSANHQAYPVLELEIIPRSVSREILQEATGSHDRISGSGSSVLIHSTPARSLSMSSSQARHPLVTSKVPRITVTGATPEVMSPVSNLVTLNDVDIEALDQVVQCSTGKDEGALDSFSKNAVTDAEDRPPNGHDDRESFHTRRVLHFPNDVHPTSPKSPTSREIIAWFHPDQNTYGEDSLKEDEEKPAKINYGSLSFGHRYSLVSSDCISLSSDSSRSSLDSIVFADEGRGCHGSRVLFNNTHSGQLTPRAADEGIFSDERDSPAKTNVSASDEPDKNSEASTPQKTRVNAQFPVLAKYDKQDTLKEKDLRQTPEKSRVISPSSEDGYALVELLMDAPSTPSSSLKRRNREAGNSTSSEEQAGVDDKEPRFAREGSVSEREDGHESESTDVSSDSNHRRIRHRSCDQIETTANDSQSSRTRMRLTKDTRLTFRSCQRAHDHPGDEEETASIDEPREKILTTL